MENRHSIFVHCKIQDALPEVIRWGEAGWWPKNSLMRFTRYGQGEVKIGARYQQKVALPFAPSWDAEVSEVSDTGITRRFLNGMFRGEETVSLKDAGDACEVCYVMKYNVCGFLNRVLWPLVFRRLHDKNIEEILGNLKKYLEARTY